MDKRSLLFVVFLSLTLFFVNLYFEQGNVESLRTWNAQQATKKTEKIKQLKQEIASRTVPLSELPIVVLYADEAGKEPLATAVGGDDSALTFAWTEDLPQTVYVHQANSNEKITKLSLASTNITEGSLVVYRRAADKLLQVGELPEFGTYELQLVDLPIDAHATSPAVYMAQYVDGSFEIPQEKVLALQKELEDGEQKKSASALTIRRAIALIKMPSGKYLPTAVYQGQSGQIERLEVMPNLAALIKKPEKKVIPTRNGKAQEQFYVLETPYQQLVFSNYGAALVEVNLPFNSEQDELSVVKEIEFDRDMLEKHPSNAHFPSHPYFTSAKAASGSLVEHPLGELGGYYPLLRRDIISKDPRKSTRVPPKYYGLNIVSEYPETAELTYEVKSFDDKQIVFEAIQAHRRITKTYSIASETQAPYTIDLTINIEGDARGLWLTSGIPEVEWISGAPAPALKYRITRNNKPEVENIEIPKDSTTSTATYLDWLCNSNGFLGMILDPLAESDPGYRVQVVPGTVVPSKLVLIDEEYGRFKAAEMPGYMLYLPIKSTGGTTHFRVFAGPFAESVLKTVDKVYTNAETGYNPDYIACQSFHGWFAFISEPFAKFLFILMKFFHSLTGSWAFSIVLLTVALRIMLYPLNAWSTKSMVRMQQIAPEVTAIQEKYKKDPKKAQLEIMNLYRERGVNPVSGCFPLLIQMPFLIGMFDLLKSTFELRGASFIPGWIDNLTSPDVLFSWGISLPLLGSQFHLLPILLGVVMFVQQRFMSSAPTDVSQLTDQQRQQRVMGNIMAVVFTVMFYNFPSGLNIYWLSSMLLGMGQQYWTTKKMKAQIPKSQELLVVAPVSAGKKKK